MGPVQHTDICCNRTIKFVWSGDANNNTEEEGDDNDDAYGTETVDKLRLHPRLRVLLPRPVLGGRFPQ